jgi:hypothetical protein
MTTVSMATKGGAPAREAERQGERVARSDGFEGLARAGLVARGVVYGIIGILALKLALGDGGQATNQQGALQTIAQGPFGKVLLALMAIGLIGYAAWRLIRAALGHGPEQSDDTKDRIAGFVSGIAYAALCVTALQILFGSGSSGGPSNNPNGTTGGVLDWPAGQVIVVIAGLVFIGVGLDQARKGLKKEFLEDSKTEEMSSEVRKAFTAIGVSGHVARAIVFALVGWFLIRAAVEYDPDKAVGLDGALAQLGKAAYGPILLGLVAAGLICFAAYSVADARYRRV